jgi:tetratricopeptide (TPR) repeat protein
MAANPPNPEDLRLKRWIYIAVAALVVVVAVFAVLYYRDRYATPSGVVDAPGPVEALEAQVKANPTDVNARLSLANNYLAHKRYADAIKQAQEVATAYPKNDGALLLLGVAYNLNGNPTQAVTELNAYLKVHKKDPHSQVDSRLEAAYYFLGDSYLTLKKPADALKQLKNAIALNPTDADALYKLGVAEAASGKPKDAVSHFELATQLVPDYKEAYQGLVGAYKALGEQDLAGYAGGMVDYASGDYKAALAALEPLAAKNKDSVPTLLGLGLTYEALDQPAKAKVVLKSALDQQPGNVAVKQALGRVTEALQQ